MRTTVRALALALTIAALTACGGAEKRAAQYLERAQASYDAGDYVKAELDAKNTLQIQPNNFEATLLMAEIAEKQNRLPEIFRFLRRAVEIDPSNLDAQVKMGRMWTIAGRIDEAEATADAVLGLEPGNPEGLILRATIEARKGNLEEAENMGLAVLADHPRNVSALAFLASMYQKKDVERSLTLLDQAIAADSDNRSLREIKVRMLLEMQPYDRAEKELRDLIVEFPEQNAYRYTLAQLMLREERLDDAENVLVTLIREAPEDLTAKITYTQFIAEKRGLEQAEKLLDGYIAAEPDVHAYRFTKARLLAKAERLGDARKVLELISQRDRDGASGLQARTQLAALELQEGNIERGSQLIEDVLAQEASNIDALVMRATLALKDVRSDDAISDLRNVLRADPNSERGLLLLGKAHMQAGEPNLAIEQLTRLVDTHKGNFEGRKDLARLLIQAGRWEEVRSLLEVAVQQRPDDLAVSRLYVDTLVRLERWTEAEAEAERILALDPGKALGHYVKARVFQARGSYEASINPFKVALDIEPRSVEAITGLIRSYVQINEIEEAEQFLQDFIANHPDSIHAHTLLGEMYARKSDWTRAVELNEKALSMEASWLPAYRNLIGIHLRQNDLAAADSVVDRGLAQAPDNTELMLLRANIYERGGQFEKAIEVYGAELAKNPGLDIAANNYVALVADHRKDDMASLDSALRYAERFRETENPIFQDTLGWLLYRRGEIEEAVPLLEQAVAQAGQLPQLRYHLGMAYFRQDKLELARRELEAALQDADAEYAGREEARQTLQQL